MAIAAGSCMLAFARYPTYKEAAKLEETGLPPKAWIGQEVRLTYWAGDKGSTANGTLESVGERGITVIHEEEPRFFPWHAVLEISPP